MNTFSEFEGTLKTAFICKILNNIIVIAIASFSSFRYWVNFVYLPLSLVDLIASSFFVIVLWFFMQTAIFILLEFRSVCIQLFLSFSYFHIFVPGIFRVSKFNRWVWNRREKSLLTLVCWRADRPFFTGLLHFGLHLVLNRFDSFCSTIRKKVLILGWAWV